MGEVGCVFGWRGVGDGRVGGERERVILVRAGGGVFVGVWVGGGSGREGAVWGGGL